MIESLPCTIPAGSNRVKVKASTNSSKRHAILQTDRDRDGEVVHHRPEACPFLVHVDEDLAQGAVGIFSGAQIDLVTAHDGLLGIAPAPFRHPLAALGDFLDDDLFDHLLGQHRRLFLRRSTFEDFGGFVVILDQAPPPEAATVSSRRGKARWP